MMNPEDKDYDDGGRGDRGDRKGGKGGKDKGGRKRGFARRKVCRFCADKNVRIDYKNPAAIKRLVTERGKIVPRRISGVCAKHQRGVALAVKRARHIALMPYASTGASA